MRVYRAEVVREGDYWVVTAEAEGLHLGGQVKRLEDAGSVMQSIVAAALDVAVASVSAEVDVR